MNRSTKQLTVSALLFALGLVLPFLTGQVPQIGNMLLPMHFPVFLCGWQYALFLGFLLPICRSMIFGMPHMFPVAIAMAFELAAYGLIAGLIYGHSKQKSTASLYIALISAMILGRVVWALWKFCCWVLVKTPSLGRCSFPVPYWKPFPASYCN